MLEADTQKRVDNWLDGPYDDETKLKIRQLLENDPQSLVDAFYKTLSFGTGGLRGIMGVGTNRINIYTIRAATQGFANYLIMNAREEPCPQKIVIGYDSRENSKIFAEETAKVLAGNGINALLFEDLRPTPLISFACRHYKCHGAIMITASHNPPEYNGYKVYWADGGQVLPPHDTAIIAEVENILGPGQIMMVEGLDNSLISSLGKEVDDAYIRATSSYQLYSGVNAQKGKELKVVYTPLHGTGGTLVPKTLASWGFTTVDPVKEQCAPDGRFPTVKSPNPEEPKALEIGINQMLDTDGDILIATDPDADRVGIAVNHRGTAILLSGNHVACLCLEHICSGYRSNGALPEKAAFVKTIVTSEMFQAIADYYERPCFNVLTGFKYIAELMDKWEKSPDEGHEFIFGGEESYGYLLGNSSHDKDAVISSALICEAALQAKIKGKTLVDNLNALFEKYGVYIDKLKSIGFSAGKQGFTAMEYAMERLQQSPPDLLGGQKICCFDDYTLSKRTYVDGNTTEQLTLPKNNMVVLWLSNGTKLTVRPSGTEPKIKIYCSLKGCNHDGSTVEDYDKMADNLLNEMASHLQLWAGEVH